MTYNVRIKKMSWASWWVSRPDNCEIVNPATEFAPNTLVIFCVWRADGVRLGAPMRGVWIAEDVGKVAPPNYKIDEAAAKVLIDNEGYFSLSKPNNRFPVGKYRLDIHGQRPVEDGFHSR